MPVSDPTKEIGKLIAGRFIERREVKAVQSKSGAYHPEHEPFTLTDLVAHVEGRRTFGHYVVSADNTCRMLCFDIDLKEGRRLEPPMPDPNPAIFYREGYADQKEIWPRQEWTTPTDKAIKKDLAIQMRVLAQGFATRMKELLGVMVAVAYSGSKGMHVYGMFDPLTPAHEAREGASMVLDSLQDFELERGKNFYRHVRAFAALSIEVFPKQDEVRANGGLGNLIRLPLGINQKSGRPGWFINLDTPLDQFTQDDPLLVLQEGSLR